MSGMFWIFTLWIRKVKHEKSLLNMSASIIVKTAVAVLCLWEPAIPADSSFLQDHPVCQCGIRLTDMVYLKQSFKWLLNQS